MNDIKLAQKMGKDKVAIVGGVQGPLTTAILICGLTNIFTKIVDDPRFVKEIFKLSNEFFAVAVKKMIEAGATRLGASAGIKILQQAKSVTISN